MSGLDKLEVRDDGSCDFDGSEMAASHSGIEQSENLLGLLPLCRQDKMGSYVWN